MNLNRMYISFKIRPCPDPEFAVIYMRLQTKGKRVEFSLDLKIRKSKWDTRKNQVKGSPETSDLLTLYESKARQLRLVHPEKSLKEIRNLIFGPDPEIVEMESPEINLVQVGQMLMEMKERKLALSKLAPATLRRNRDFQRHLEFVFTETGWKWPLDQIKTKNLEDFEIWIRNRKEWHWNTASKIMNYLKEVIKFGMANALIPARPIVFRVNFLATDHHSLNSDHVKKLERKIWKEPALARMADCFLFQCYTGLAYSDMAQFRPELHLKVNDLNELIELKRKKSPREGKFYLAKVPLLPAAKRILEKYNYRLPVVSNQNFNSYLKIIGEFLDLDFPLTSHIARKTFCTILFNAGITIEMIGEWVGHSTAKTTLASYAKGDSRTMSGAVLNVGYGT